jgi:DNA-binding NarL/FixJ family response regulator
MSGGGGATTRLVIVEDHEAVRDALAALLELRGFDVLGVAGNVAAGFDLVEQAEPDVAVIDVALPDGSGIDLTRRLLRGRPDLAVLLYTGDADATRLASGLGSGARGYALKSGSVDELVEAIERVAAGDSYVDPRLDQVVIAGPREGARSPQLSPREREVLHLMAEGFTGEAIARRLGLSVETVRTHARNVIRKLQARNRVHAIAIALQRGDITLEGRDGAPEGGDTEPGVSSRG